MTPPYNCFDSRWESPTRRDSINRIPYHTPHEPQPLNTFCAKHCVNCQAGWVRSTKLGATVVICLIDREPVLANITACNKFKPIEI